MIPGDTSPPVEIRPLRPADVGPLVAHLARHMRESGQGGAPHFAPRAGFDLDEMRARIALATQAPLAEPMWERAWLAWAPDAAPGQPSARVVGHVDLRGGRLRAELHRATLGMGLERDFRGKGLGERLARTAIAWARDEAGLAWIDLFVFAGNAPARALYRKLGFEERGSLEDAFRLHDGTVIDDVRMTLPLRR